MRVLVVRHEADAVTWQTHNLDVEAQYPDFLEIIKAHLNTAGVTRLEIILEQ